MADGNKTEKATEQRRKQARKKGQVVRSRDLPGIAAAAAVTLLLICVAPTAVMRWGLLYRGLMDAAASGDLDPNGPVLFWPAVEVLHWVVPTMFVALLASLCAGLMQGGFNLAPEALTLRFERFNPVTRLGQMFSPLGLANLLKSLLPFSAIAWIAVNIMQSQWAAIVDASNVGLRSFAGLVGSMILEFVYKSGLVLLVWAAVDYLLTLKKMESDLRMSKQEVREEHKETDGNPQIKGRIRQLRRRLRRAQSLKAAATATVVVTNPTHYAVALRYEPDMDAPVVVAKGLDLLAEKIKRLAQSNNIMLVENRPLAQALYKTVEVGDSIPAALYQAVAEILAFVYRAQAEVRRADAERRSRSAAERAPAAAGPPPSTAAEIGGQR
ncbi:flagellar type III secretion system protein FlhB [Granulicella sp. 5B5]|uniref:EscU/YscU/HrcU family type III secretion system export apparatus switch protein n=1 Tax=Granulicella sp. 5B5 TaxID=1617967 RepID=UPI0015F75854|nr:EscU/YscU/HrcU family type III secretion system export apparatus switch protein [Granulicella sp. 5B5]QMV17517.1 flagellar type III secretion system protein FlhB [Granulicella sp. 5B5]